MKLDSDIRRVLEPLTHDLQAKFVKLAERAQVRAHEGRGMSRPSAIGGMSRPSPGHIQAGIEQAGVGDHGEVRDLDLGDVRACLVEMKTVFIMMLP
jgi:hypothetical protein